ncbi:MAG: carbohydrate-binding family 9-like protein, partial [Lentisphaerae bacterium]|nr:carbohydrate-binding family 9-like protein [Lentisphaerota bacterium]
NKPAWQDVPALQLDNFMGERPEHFPVTRARLCYDSEAVYLIFHVQDRYVRAVTEQEFHGNVCQDSCVEFFFTPGAPAQPGYFNLEINCGGVMLLHWQTIPRKPTKIDPADCRQVEIFHQLPRMIDPEIDRPTDWTIECRLPLAVLQKYAPIAKPAPGVEWHGNFYKCASRTSHPHLLTWSPINSSRRDFHRPDYFGHLLFV